MLVLYVTVSPELIASVHVKDSFTTEAQLADDDIGCDDIVDELQAVGIDCEDTSSAEAESGTFRCRSYKEYRKRTPTLIVASIDGVSDVVTELETFMAAHPSLVPDKVVAMVETYIRDTGALKRIPKPPGFVDPVSDIFFVKYEWVGWKPLTMRITISKTAM